MYEAKHKKNTLYTIGYTSCIDTNDEPSLEVLVQILKKFFIGALVDVRSSPYGSSYYSDFSENILKNRLKKHGIYYMHFGREFGARPEDPDLQTNGRADFKKMAESEQFIEGCKRIHSGLEKMNICLLCAEKDPLQCHRAVLVANNYRKLYPDDRLCHIETKKEAEEYIPFVETQEEIDSRLLDEGKKEEDKNALLDFFNEKLKTREERLQQAYSLKEEKIAYRFNKTEKSPEYED